MAVQYVTAQCIAEQYRQDSTGQYCKHQDRRVEKRQYISIWGDVDKDRRDKKRI